MAVLNDSHAGELRVEAIKLVRQACSKLAEWEQTSKWGNDAVFQNSAGRLFAIIGEWKGELLLSVKVGKASMDVFTADSRYIPAPYLARGGWVALRLNTGMEPAEIAELVQGSYGLIEAGHRRKQASRSPAGRR